jgi:hypothetical protein
VLSLWQNSAMRVGYFLQKTIHSSQDATKA